jgi:hypothetical protein
MQCRYVLLGLLLATAAFPQDSVSTRAVSGIFSGSAHFGPAPQHIQAVTGAPYSAEESSTTVQTLADGTHITHSSSTHKVYRDSAGRTRTERPFGPNSAVRKQKSDAPLLIEITDPVERVKFTLDTVNKVAHKQMVAEPRKSAPRAAAARPSPTAEAAAEDAPKSTHEKLENQTIEGVLVEGTRDTTVYPAASVGNDRPFSVVHERWWSPELKVTVLSMNTDPRSGDSTLKLINLSRSEPDPSLFVPPADYSVVEEKGDFTIKWGAEIQ